MNKQTAVVVGVSLLAVAGLIYYINSNLNSITAPFKAVAAGSNEGLIGLADPTTSLWEDAQSAAGGAIAYMMNGGPLQ